MYTIRSSSFALITLLVALLHQSGCGKSDMSVLKLDAAKGLNGSFEHFTEGLPVNWQVYTAQTVPSGDFDIQADTIHVKDGKQSLHFNVRSCEDKGGWYSPGIATQFPAKVGERYNVSFWIRHEGGAYRAKVSGISTSSGSSEQMVLISEEVDDWRRIEHTYTIPTKMSALRFELNLLQEGRYWIDDIRIEKQ